MWIKTTEDRHLCKGELGVSRDIPLKLIAEIDASEKNEAIIKRLKQLITEIYRDPDADAKFEGCTEEVPQELSTMNQITRKKDMR